MNGTVTARLAIEKASASHITAGIRIGKRQNVENHHFKTKAQIEHCKRVDIGRMDRDLKREIAKSLINNKTQNAGMRRMPHMKGLCECDMLLCY